MPQLLSREEFKQKVFERDSSKCVSCSMPAVDAHHILDRSLWGTSGGYYLDNGVSLCADCHLEAEKTLVSCEKLREVAGITEVVLPDHFFVDDKYDHWGNTTLPTGVKLKGELFGNENVQKIMKEAGVLGDFIKYIRFPRTYHAPWSENLQNDDRRHEDITFLLNKPVVVSLKMDGENSSLYRDYIHARSINSGHHVSRSWLKAFHGQIAHEIPEGFRLCGESLYAKHSIHYKNLKSYFYLFSVWDDNNVALSWKNTCEYAELIGLQTVPVICTGTFSSIEDLRNSIEQSLEEYQKTDDDEIEGYVIRLAGPITYREFRKSTAKMVRKNHVRSSENWLTQAVVPNKLKGQQ